MNDNWQNINSIKNKFFSATVFKAKCSDIIPLEKEFDLVIVFNSTEERTLEYSKLFEQKKVTNSLLIDFKNSVSELKSTNSKRNQQILAEISINTPQIISDLDIFCYEESLQKIIQSIPSDLFNKKSSFFIDITGVPLIYSTSLFKILKLRFPSPDLYLLNVSASYTVGTNSSFQFSEGEIENIYIPSYYGRPDFSKPWLYIFLLGFEGNRSLSILKQNQPDFCEAIIAQPGYQDDYEKKAIEINSAFLSESNIEVNELIRVDAGDPVALCEKILEIYKSTPSSNICIVPLGTKPHAIGAGMASIIQENISIMYQVPKRYSMNDTKSGEYLWLYEIK